jgi:CO/xanthine dehydrogenase FAD-binding subunit
MSRPDAVLVPRSLTAARVALDRAADAVVLGGGTWLVPSWTAASTAPRLAVTVGRVRDATEVARDGCGAATTARRLLAQQVPTVLRQAAASLVRPAVVNAVTAAGNLVAPGPRCLGVALLALGATCQVWDGKANHWMDADIDSVLDAAPRLITAFRWSPPAGSAFTKLRERPTGGAVLASAAAAWAGAAHPEVLRIAIGGGTMARPRLCPAAMAAWAATATRSPSPAAAAAVADALELDLLATSDYERHLRRELVRRVVAATLAEGSSP